MSLIRLTDEILKYNERIVLIGRSTTAMSDFFCHKHLADRVEVILNDNKREQHDVSVDGKSFPVRDFAALNNLVEGSAGVEYLFIIVDDYYREVYDELCAVTSVAEKDLDVYYYLNKENAVEQEYRDKYKDEPLRDIIVFRSGPHPTQYVHGMDFGDNARAVFEYMLSARLNDKYELVWIVKDPAEFSRFSDVKNVSFVSFEWSTNGSQEQMDEYYRALCLSKYLFFTDAYGFARNCRNDQVRIQLWHGCGFKTRVNFTRCEKRYELMPVISPVYKEIHKRIYGLRDDQVVITGYPKEDWLFHPVEQSFTELFGVAEASRYIMWLPTFRESEGQFSNLNEYSIGKETGLPVADTLDKLRRLNELLAEKNAVIIIKLHPFQKRSAVNCDGFSNIVIIENADLDEMDIPINRILGKMDALISDYSSAAIDYLILNRPMGFLLEDVDEYANSRGFVFDPIRDYIPGAELYDFEDMIKFVEELCDGIDSSFDKRQKVRKELHSFDDDRSSERLLKVLGIL